MRSENRRGATLALCLACGFVLAAFATVEARAQDFHTIPRLVPAVDLNTGEPYYAPPVPNGHYAGKNLIGRCTGKVNGLVSSCTGLLHGNGLLGKGCGPCGTCGGNGCDACGGTGDACGGKGGHGHGLGLGKLGHGGACGNDGACGTSVAGPGPLFGSKGCGGLLHKHGGFGGDGCGHSSTIIASGQGAPSPQVLPTTYATAQCGDPGCKLFSKHKHFGGHAVADPCNSCGGKGCGLCGGKGLLNGLCNACGGKGCGLCAGLSNLCKLCGGAGCAACSKAKGLVNHLLGRDRIEWFVGAGGPVPLTPGYTPYVNVTRSPRDFFAFPPMTP